MCNESERARPVWVDLNAKGIISSVYDKEEHTFGGIIGLNTWGIKKKPVAFIPYEKKLVALDDEHFGWRLERYDSDGVPVEKIYTRKANMAANKKDNDSCNTLKLNPLRMVVLDCGLWGAYKRAREYQGKDRGPQRDFGLVENGWVWLAQYVSALNKKESELKDITEATCKELKEKKAKLTHALALIVQEGGMGAIKLLKHARADATLMTVETKKNMYICFPDLHLSDKWPELPDAKHRYGGTNPTKNQMKVRLKLQKKLRDCQSLPGIRYGNRVGPKTAESFQIYLEYLEKHSLVERWNSGNSKDRESSDFSDVSKHGTKHLWGAKEEIPISAGQLLAEKDVVDRALRIHSTWFCGPGKKYVNNERHTKEPPYGKENDLLYKTLKEEAPGDEGPAFDLVNFLAAIRQLRFWMKDKKRHYDCTELHNAIFSLNDANYTADHVKVRQLGDMCEMWMNHEFLYHGFWVRKTGQGGGKARMIIRRGVKKLNPFKYEDFQCRKDEFHYHPEGKEISGPNFKLQSARRAKWYTYNHMNTEEQKFRHVVGDMIDKTYYDGDNLKKLEESFNLPKDEIKRRRYLLKKRMESILAFSMPFSREAKKKIKSKFYDSQQDYLVNFYKEYLGQDPCDIISGNGNIYFAEDANKGYTKKGSAERGTEVYWNKLIWDLFKIELEGEAVYGNHDGYRGDPLLCHDGNLDKKYQSKGWISEPGLWFEHAHRWDPYNRDGCSFGQGGTNMAYYYMHILGGFSIWGKLVKKSEEKFSKERQRVEAGAAIWYLVLDSYSKNNLDWFKDNLGDSESKLHPFGIYICGHSHSADLAYVFLEPPSSLKKKKDEERKNKEKEEKEERKRKEKEEKEERKRKKERKEKPYLYKSKDLADEESKKYEAHVAGDKDVELDWLKKRD